MQPRGANRRHGWNASRRTSRNAEERTRDTGVESCVYICIWRRLSGAASQQLAVCSCNDTSWPSDSRDSRQRHRPGSTTSSAVANPASSDIHEPVFRSYVSFFSSPRIPRTELGTLGPGFSLFLFAFQIIGLAPLDPNFSEPDLWTLPAAQSRWRNYSDDANGALFAPSPDDSAPRLCCDSVHVALHFRAARAGDGSAKPRMYSRLDGCFSRERPLSFSAVSLSPPVRA